MNGTASPTGWRSRGFAAHTAGAIVQPGAIMLLLTADGERFPLRVGMQTNAGILPGTLSVLAYLPCLVQRA